MNKYLIKLADHLDKKGLHKEANYVDWILKSAMGPDLMAQEGYGGPIKHDPKDDDPAFEARVRDGKLNLELMGLRGDLGQIDTGRHNLNRLFQGVSLGMEKIITDMLTSNLGYAVKQIAQNGGEEQEHFLPKKDELRTRNINNFPRRLLSVKLYCGGNNKKIEKCGLEITDLYGGKPFYSEIYPRYINNLQTLLKDMKQLKYNLNN